MSMIYLTPKQVAEQLGVHHKTIYKWVDRRRIKYIKFGSKLAFKQEFVDEFVELNTVETRVLKEEV